MKEVSDFARKMETLEEQRTLKITQISHQITNGFRNVDEKFENHEKKILGQIKVS